MDAERNGNAYRDEFGRYADFHALRHAWATFLQRDGVSQRIAMKLTRQSGLKLTSRVYTDENQLPLYEATNDLPRLPGYAPIRAQVSGAEGQNESRAVALVENSEAQKNPVNTGLCRTLTVSVAGSEMERAKGFEPCTQYPQATQGQGDVKAQSGGYAQIRAQDSDLTEVASSWANLSPALKTAILAIIRSAKTTEVSE